MGHNYFRTSAREGVSAKCANQPNGEGSKPKDSGSPSSVVLPCAVIWLKAVVLPFLLWLSAVLTIATDHIWRDRRTKKHKRIRNLVVVTTTLIAVSTGAVMWTEIAQSQRLERSVADLQFKVQNEVDRAKARDEKAVLDRSQLLEQMDLVEGQLQPFIDLARESYPTASEAEALDKLRGEIEDVRAHAHEIERKAAPRKLTPSQRSRLASSLREASVATVEIQYDPTDSEAAVYGRQLASALRLGGWAVEEFPLMALGPLPGLHIFYKDNPRSVEVGRQLNDALAVAGVTPIGRLSDAPSDWDVRLYVGPKPNE